MGTTKKNLILGVLFTIIFLLAAAFIIPMAVEVDNPEGVTPATWPKMVALFTGVLALLLAILSAMALKKVGDTPDEGADKINWLRFALTVLCLISFYYLVDFLGIVLASTIIFIGFSRICGPVVWKKIIPIAILLPIVLYFFFTKLAHVPMPLGIFYNYL